MVTDELHVPAAFPESPALAGTALEGRGPVSGSRMLHPLQPHEKHAFPALVLVETNEALPTASY